MIEISASPINSRKDSRKEAANTSQRRGPEMPQWNIPPKLLATYKMRTCIIKSFPKTCPKMCSRTNELDNPKGISTYRCVSKSKLKSTQDTSRISWSLGKEPSILGDRPTWDQFVKARCGASTNPPTRIGLPLGACPTRPCSCPRRYSFHPNRWDKKPHSIGMPPTTLQIEHPRYGTYILTPSLRTP